MTAYCWVATIVCIIGTIINVKRINYCFLFWMAGEVMWVLYDVGQELWSRVILDLLGLVLAIWGAYENLYLKNRKGKDAD